MTTDKYEFDWDKIWDVHDWYEDIEDGVWPYSDAFLKKMQSGPMYGEIGKECQDQEDE